MHTAGYITEATLMNILEQFSKDFQKIEKEKIAKMQHFTWKQLYNCGKDVSKGVVCVRACVRYAVSCRSSTD